jgi:hypothetical protein
VLIQSFKRRQVVDEGLELTQTRQLAGRQDEDGVVQTDPMQIKKDGQPGKINASHALQFPEVLGRDGMEPDDTSILKQELLPADLMENVRKAKQEMMKKGEQEGWVPAYLGGSCYQCDLKRGFSRGRELCGGCLHPLCNICLCYARDQPTESPNGQSSSPKG